MNTLVQGVIGLISIIALLCSELAACSLTHSSLNQAFERVAVGDSERAVEAKLGHPSVRESQAQFFSRYASSPCTSPCVARLWYENHWSMGIEAWSVTLGKDGKVLHTAHWMSP